jgi:ABC-type phosphate transport system substrate-binding protein
MRVVRLTVVLALAAFAATAQRPRESVTFVVSARSEVRDLSRAELRRIFLGQTSRWGNRHRIVLCIRPTDSPEGRIVLDRLVQMSDIDYSQHWIGAVFRGAAASAPAVYPSREALLKAVSNNPDAIGFVLTSEQPPAPARAITVDRKTAEDPSYPIAR